MEREVRYCTTEDGVRIAYCVEGEGPPLLVCPFFVESFALSHAFGGYEAFVRHLGRDRKLIRYDARGTGLSQREADDFSHGAMVRDVAAVMRAAVREGESAVLYAQGLSGPRCIDYAAHHQEVVSKLVLHSTFSEARAVMSEEALEAFAQLARVNWPIAVQALADLSGREDAADLNVRAARMFRESTDGETCARMLRGMYETTDVKSLLSEIDVPTLVIGWSDTRLFTAAYATKIAAGIRTAKFVLLSGGTNWLSGQATSAFSDAMDNFLGRESQTAKSDHSRGTPDLRTVLFTDLVGHTEMMSRLGDERGREVLREHERNTREVLRAHGGTEVKTMGDGFMASFGSVTRAVECAVALQRAVQARNEKGERGNEEPIEVRCGLNAGEPIEEEGDLFGATVILASRIAARAEGGEILVADTVRGLCSGKGFLFADRGEFVAKGFEEPVRVYEVRWRE